jgi:hypothetical protein
MSCHVMSCHVMSCHVMSCHVMTYIKIIYQYQMLVVDSKRYGKIHPSEYMMNAARQVLALNNFEKVLSGVVEHAIAWRLQKQFNDPEGKGKKSELTEEIDKGGFVVGCQMGHLVKTMNRHKRDNTPVALLFDIFQNKGRGEFDEGNHEVGPTIPVRKQIVRALRRVFKKIIVVEAVLQKTPRADFALADPLGSHLSYLSHPSLPSLTAFTSLTSLTISGLIYQDRSTFVSWVEVAIGVSSRKLIHAGGHFAEVLAEFRNGRRR